MRAVGYVRVSTDEQTTSGAGLDAQLHALREHCDKHGIELVATFSDEGVSGAAALDKRPGLLDAVNAVERGGILLVSKRDRLSRDPVSAAVVERMVAKRRGRIVSAAGEGTDGDAPTDVLLRRIVDAFAEHERLVIAARTRAALKAKARKGERVGPLPLGYVADKPARHLRPDDESAAILLPVEEELETVALIKDLRAAGRSMRAIAAELTAAGIVTKRGKTSWSHSTVQRILERPAA
jgi:DNA invertase Pin-like site-specific DNA recombinase